MKRTDIQNKLNIHNPALMGSRQLRKYAILLPLVEKEDGIHILFEIRSLTLRRQPGDICFPGGKVDKGDSSEMAAAVRETVEELGVLEEDLTEIRALDYIFSPLGMMIYPYAGFVAPHAVIRPNPAEVEGVFSVPLSYFMRTEPDVYSVALKPELPDDFPFDLLVGGKSYEWQAREMHEYFYMYEGHVIWGLTAQIMKHFISLLKSG